MMQFLKNNRLVIIGVIIALIALVSWWLFFRKKTDEDSQTGDSRKPSGGSGSGSSGSSGSGSGSSGSGSGSSSGSESSRIFPLKRGSKGPEVVALQKFLNHSDSSYKLKVDGVFGPLTEAAVKSELPGGVSSVSEAYYNDFVAKFDSRIPNRS